MKASVGAEQLRMILSHTAIGTVVATTFALFMAIQLNGGALGATVPPYLLAYWVLVKVAISLGRIAHAHIYRMNGQPKDLSWQRWTTGLLAVDGAIWGAGGAWMMGASTELIMVIIACLCCIASVATFGLQVRAAATAAYVVPMLAPLTVPLLLRRDDSGLIGCIGLIHFIGLLLSSALRAERRLAEVFRLRLVTEKISAELERALDLAQRSSRAKDQFLGTLSHELRTPLHGILGLTRLARGDVPRSEVALHMRLEFIEDSGEHLLRMVNDLLDISSIESGRLDLRIEPMNLSREIALLRETYLARANEAGIRFTITTAGPIGDYVCGDSVRIGQVLHNLLSNAFKFTPLGGAVSMNISRGQDATLRFEVRDSGPGIAQEEMERVFEIFTQGTKRTGSRPEGVGLGLAIARQLARAMGGDVTCLSEVGRGSSFAFTARLPLALPEDLAEDPSFITITSKRTGAGCTVAMAEDDEVSALINATVVRGLGADFEEFGDGRSLLARVLRDSGRPDLVLLDWDMPSVDGERATIAIREFERVHDLPRIPIVGLSANAAPDFDARARRAGMDEFLRKPCTPEELEAVLGNYLPVSDTSHAGRHGFAGASERGYLRERRSDAGPAPTGPPNPVSAERRA